MTLAIGLVSSRMRHSPSNTSKKEDSLVTILDITIPSNICQVARPRFRGSLTRMNHMEMLPDGLLIRHVYECHVWVARYDSSTQVFKNPSGQIFTSPSRFAKEHLIYMRDNELLMSTRRKFEVNGWTGCECKVNGEWITLDEFVNNQ